MLKKCKWCGKEQEMNGKREFCPGEQCKNAYKYSKRTGKLGKKSLPKEVPSKTKPINTLVGLLTKVTTTMDQCLRIQVDVPVEKVKFDTVQYLNHTIVIGFIEEDGKKAKEQAESGKDEFFDN